MFERISVILKPCAARHILLPPSVKILSRPCALQAFPGTALKPEKASRMMEDVL
jgi:hypothetical protein